MIQARAKIANMAPPTLSRMIRVADLEAGGYGSLGGTKVVVYIVVTVVASDMFFCFFLFWEVGWGQRRWGRTSGKHRRASWVGSVREFIFFSPRDELTKINRYFCVSVLSSKQLFRKCE